MEEYGKTQKELHSAGFRIEMSHNRVECADNYNVNILYISKEYKHIATGEILIIATR